MRANGAASLDLGFHRPAACWRHAGVITTFSVWFLDPYARLRWVVVLLRAYLLPRVMRSHRDGWPAAFVGR